MKCWMVLLLGGFLLTGCAHSMRNQHAELGRNQFTLMQAAVEAAAAPSRDSVVLIRLVGGKQDQNRRVIRIGGGGSSGDDGTKDLQGVIVSTNGYAIVAEELDSDSFDRMEAWVGDLEYRARFVKTDPQLGMSVIQIHADEPLVALDIEHTGDLAAGDWCVGVQPSDEEYDYAAFASLAICRGVVDGHYRTILLDQIGVLRPGTVILDMSGRVAGIMHARGKALAMGDIREDLQMLLDDASGVKSTDMDAKKNAWFGALLKPINTAYARKHGLERSAIWVQHVMPGGSADEAGVQTGDLLVGVNGVDLRFSGQRAREFFVKTLRAREGEPFEVTVLRDGESLVLTGSFTTRPDPETIRADDFGITVKKIPPGMVLLQNLFTAEGVIVEDIKRGSAAAVGSNMRSSLLDKGDIITAIAGMPTPDLDTFSAALEKVRRERPEVVLVQYLRGRVTGFAALNLQLGDKGEEGGIR